MNRQVTTPVIPNDITVHLGLPDEEAKNKRIPFISYIKNVACSELYPSWHENALEANILAIISFTLNRIYLEWYPSKGYDFDITNQSSVDQQYIENRSIYENVSKMVDHLFNNYLVKNHQIQPFFAEYCDGKTSTCKGLLQWQSEELAEQGKTSLEILKYYYGSDITIIEDAKVAPSIASYPGEPLKLGDMSEHIRIIKRQLNRIRNNYPALPFFTEVHEFFDIVTENAIRTFQDIFNLEVTGIIDKSTWYKIKYLYNSVKKLSDLYSEGIKEEELQLKYELEQQEGSTGPEVSGLHYYLKVIAYFNPDIPLLEVNSVFDKNTKTMVMAFQDTYRLPKTGIVDTITWNKMEEVYLNILNHLPEEVLVYKDYIYPGRFLSLGMQGSDVEALQKMIQKLHKQDPTFPSTESSGCYDSKTETVIKEVQRRLKIEMNGVTGPLEWRYIVNQIKEVD